MFRSFMAVVLGVIVAGGLVAVVEAIGHGIYPPPSGVAAADPESVKAYVKTAPVNALLFVPLAWGVGTFAGCWLAGTIARKAKFLHALLVSFFVLLAALATLIMIPHPGWMWPVGLAVFPVALFFASRLTPKRKPAPPMVIPVHPVRR